MARAPPVSPLYNHRPITFPPNQLLSRIKTKTPYKISVVHVTAMPSQHHHHEAQAQAQAHPTLEIIGGAMESVLRLERRPVGSVIKKLTLRETCELGLGCF